MFLVSCSTFLWRYESLEVDTPRLIHNKTRVGNVRDWSKSMGGGGGGPEHLEMWLIKIT